MSQSDAKWTCTGCGANVESSGTFCPYCGKNKVEAVVAQDPGTNVPLAQPPPPPPKRRGRVVIPIIAAIVIVGMFFFVAYQGIIVIEGVTKPLETGEGDYTYEWTFKGREYRMNLDISFQQYDYYVDKNIVRAFRTATDYDHVKDFMTISDPIILKTVMNLNILADDANLNDLDTIGLALAFVQSIPYEYDIDQFYVEDYWTFPIETLVNYAGDCEDTSFLFASIAEAMNVDAVIIIFEDHIAVGVSHEDASGTYYEHDGVDYFYCETTGEGWAIGVLPEGRGSANIVDV